MHTSVNLIFVALYAVSAVLLVRRFRAHAVLLLYFFALTLWVLISCFYNDLGVYNMELFRFTEPTFSTARLAVFGLVFNAGIWFIGSLIGDRPLSRVDYRLTGVPKNLGTVKLIAFGAIAALVMFLGYLLVRDGVPLLQGIDRHTVFVEAGPVQKRVIIYGPLLAFLLGCVRLKTGRFNLSPLIFTAFVGYAVLLGNKFSFLLLLVVPYLAAYFAVPRSVSSRFRSAVFRRIALGSLAVIAIAFFAYSSYLSKMGDSRLASAYLKSRILAFEGEMWWAVDNDVWRHGRYDPYHWQAELNNVIDPDQTEDGAVGLKYLMVKAIGPQKAFPIFRSGYLYTNSYPAILIAMFPYWLALIVQFLAGALYFVLIYYLHYAVAYRHILRAGVLFVVLLPYLGLILVGNFATFVTAAMGLKILLLLALESMPRAVGRAGDVSPFEGPQGNRRPRLAGRTPQ